MPMTPVVDDGKAGGSTAPLLSSPSTSELPQLMRDIPSHSEGQAAASTRSRINKPLTSLPHITNEIPWYVSHLFLLGNGALPLSLSLTYLYQSKNYRRRILTRKISHQRHGEYEEISSSNE